MRTLGDCSATALRMIRLHPLHDPPMYSPPSTPESNTPMRAEAEALVENIKQSMGLLRRHL
jgi:hypothetical protein